MANIKVRITGNAKAFTLEYWNDDHSVQYGGGKPNEVFEVDPSVKANGVTGGTVWAVPNAGYSLTESGHVSVRKASGTLDDYFGVYSSVRTGANGTEWGLYIPGSISTASYDTDAFPLECSLATTLSDPAAAEKAEQDKAKAEQEAKAKAEQEAAQKAAEEAAAQKAADDAATQKAKEEAERKAAEEEAKKKAEQEANASSEVGEMKVLGNVSITVKSANGEILATPAAGTKFTVAKASPVNTVWVTALEGYKIDSISTCSAIVSNKSRKMEFTLTSGDSKGIEFDDAFFSKFITSTAKYTDPKATFDVTTTKTTVVPTPPTNPEQNVSASNRCYLLDSTTAAKFMSLNLKRTVAQAGASDTATVDYSKYIINYMQFGFEFDPVFITSDSAAILLDDWDTGVKAKRIGGDLITMDLGYIEMPDFTSSLNTYKTSFELFLPFMENTIKLDYAYVDGGTVKIEYELDLYLGDVTVNLYRNSEVIPFSSTTKRIGRVIPLETYTTGNYNYSSINGAVNNTFAPYIRVTSPEIPASHKAALVTTEGQLKGFKGYLEGLDVQLSGNIKSDERDQIKSLLKSGVLIK